MGEHFHSLLILMVVVWIMGKVFRALSLPVIFGELLGGVIVGPLIFGIVDPNNEVIKALAELGVFFLMLHAGLETDPHQLLKGSKRAVLIAIIGAIFPFAGGMLVSQFFGLTMIQSLFISTVISATAIAISVRMLKDCKMQNTQLGHTILSAAIISDIMVLVIFSIIIGVNAGEATTASVAIMVTKIILFFALVIGGGFYTSKYLSKFFKTKGFTFTLIMALALGFIAEWIGLHAIIGAFLAGLFIREEIIDEKVFAKIEDRIYGLSYSFLGPIFFTSLAFNLSFNGIEENIPLLIALFIVAFLGKFFGAGLGAYIQKISIRKSILVGLVMNSRGAVDLIMMSIGLSLGIINKEIFSVLILTAFTATLVAIISARQFKKHVKHIV